MLEYQNRQMEAEFLHADRRTDTLDEDKRRFSQFCKRS